MAYSTAKTIVVPSNLRYTVVMILARSSYQRLYIFCQVYYSIKFSRRSANSATENLRRTNIYQSDHSGVFLGLPIILRPVSQLVILVTRLITIPRVINYLLHFELLKLTTKDFVRYVGTFCFISKP